jgi:hypothetical protein
LAEVNAARRDRDLVLDVVLVGIPMFVLFVFAARYTVNRVRRTYLADGRGITLVITAFASAGVSLLFVAFGGQWAWIVEMLRLGDGHLSYRAARIPWAGHWVEIFLAAVLVFWAVAWHRWKVADAN